MAQERKKIGIWFGGCSTEYEVSLQSASAVLRHINQEKYEPVMIGMDRGGSWYLYQGPVERIEKDCWCEEALCTPVTVDMGHCVAEENDTCVLPKNRHMLVSLDGRIRILLDAALPVLHGKNGEDGTLQGLLELAGIPVAGCHTLASAVGMDKDMAHRLAALAGIRVPGARTFTGKDLLSGKIEEMAQELGYPLFVKPVRAGSSFGITRVTQPGQLHEAVRLALKHDSYCIMEEAIPGFEVGCAVLGHPFGELTIGEVDEIQLSQGFFDYTEKYTLKTSAIHVPARIPQEKAMQIKEAAGKIYRALGCDYFARVDMFLTPEGEIVFNEVNTIPGFTSHSRYPNMMKAAGISFDELLERLLGMVFTDELA